MKIKRIVIAGGPGSGKTSLVHSLEQAGNEVLHEISRQITLEAKRDGIDQLFLTNAVLFSEKLINGRLKQFENAANLKSETVYFDRGMPDVTAYMEYIELSYPKLFSEMCEKYKYDKIFMLPPWEKIYVKDNERYENYEEAQQIFGFLKTEYEKYGYEVILVPIGSIDERVKFITANS